MYRTSARYRSIAIFLIALSPLVAFGATGIEPKQRASTMYILVEEGASAEGNALFLKKMGLEPKLLSRALPVRFESRGGRFAVKAEGSLSYESAEPVLVERSGKLALYSVALKIRGGALPKAKKTETVDFSLAELEKSRDLVQPADRAIELAAAKAGMKKGRAWIVEITMPAPGRFEARVGLAK
jgi:hypothetical protein